MERGLSDVSFREHEQRCSHIDCNNEVNILFCSFLGVLRDPVNLIKNRLWKHYPHHTNRRELKDPCSEMFTSASRTKMNLELFRYPWTSIVAENVTVEANL
ncbi:Protein of unknown function [Gryllus bimaculatus]|nr:Protein of unknown function [Gryllus bimaculatus]